MSSSARRARRAWRCTTSESALASAGRKATFAGSSTAGGVQGTAGAGDATGAQLARTGLCAAVATLALAAPAQALDGRAVADRYWGPHACAGQVEVIYDATLADRGRDGEAVGIAGSWNGWQASCKVSVLPGLSPDRKCEVIVHEVGHLIWGPGHDGPMHPSNLKPECVPPATLTVAAPRVRRRSCKSSPQRYRACRRNGRLSGGRHQRRS